MKWPRGIQSAGLNCGIKADGARDLGLIAGAEPLTWAGTFTKNAAAAAPVHWSRAQLGRTVRAIVCNSGNANACTGVAGDQAVRETAAAVAAGLDCAPEEVLVASTGPIGVPLPLEKILTNIEPLSRGLGAEVDTFAHAIMTTDTSIKVARADVGRASIVGVAKGAAMCAPDMATMLAFIATDADVDPNTFQKVLGSAVERSFNRISIDGCESTNDSVFALASGVAGEIDEGEFELRLTEVCSSLAEQIARDAEGASRLMRIHIKGASTDEAAAALGRAVADSVLWRCAVHGSDPNWGRVLSALGYVDRDLDLQEISLSIGSETVFEKGEPIGDLVAAAKHMSKTEFEIECTVGRGGGRAQVLSADTSPEYVSLNAEGTS